ncbi:amino acid adenylation domain-containing protein, partial [Bacillus subtilis]
MGHSKIQDIYSLTPIQKGMLFHSIADPNSSAYFVQNSFDLNGVFDIRLFEQSINALIARHDILRTVFSMSIPKQPLQMVLKSRRFKLKYEDISHIDIMDQQDFVKKFEIEDRLEIFDLKRGPLMRITVLKLNPASHRIVWSFHHILMDGWCMPLIFRETFQIYQQLHQGERVVLPDVPAYGTYIEWLEKQNQKKASAYWGNYLRGYDQKIELVNRNQELQSYNSEFMKFSLGKEETKSLNNIAKKYKVTMNTLLQTIWGITIQKITNSTDVVFGSVVSGRPAEIEGIEQMVGLFINTIPVRVTCNGDDTFVEIMRRNQTNALESSQYDYYPLYEIQSQSEAKQGLVNHIMIFENYPVDQEMDKMDSGNSLPFKFSNLSVHEQTNYDFNIMVIPGENIKIQFQYNSLVYGQKTIKQFKKYIIRTMEQIINDPHLCIKDIDLLSKDDKKQLLLGFNNNQAEYPKDKTIHKLFEKQVERTPNHIAVECQGQGLSYRELNNRANQLARKLRERGVKSSSIVGIMVDRSLEMIIGIMGILKAGGAYLPIDPEYPSDRIQYMLNDSKSSIILTKKDLLNKVSTQHEIILLESEMFNDDSLLDQSGNLESKSGSEDLAYIIYTSGSTGKPKGVMISHRAVNNFIYGMSEHIVCEYGKTMLALTTISFDIFVMETFFPLLKGLRVVIASDEEKKDPKLLCEVIAQQGIDLLQATPSTFRMIMTYDQNLDCLNRIEYILVGGESFSEHLLEKFSKLSQSKIFNLYGPTEATIWCTVRNLTNSKSIDIGKPIQNTQILILDKNQNLQPIEVEGELCISGDGLAKGYLNNPSLTKEKFVRHPIEPWKRLYRTGDIAKWLPDGNIKYIGRIDHQVKIRGYRIELCEIESQLLKYEHISETIVTAVKGQEENSSLYAYFTSDK